MTARRSGATDLELFLFGGAMKQDPHVDHFIPWSRYPRDLAQNFVLAHGACNLDKGDMLSAPAHLAHWVKRNRESGADRELEVPREALKYLVFSSSYQHDKR